jgi:hypothetical protein
MRHGLAIVASICALGLIGCSPKPIGGGSAPAGQDGASQSANAQAADGTGQPQPVAVPADAGPDHVVSVFLDAIRRGDSTTTEALLTTKAREELEKENFAVVPEATPHMQFQILGTQIVGQNSGAHVRCRWTERYEDGEESYEVTWVLRQQLEGWRVAGLAMQLVPEQPAQFLNFEDVADMERKKDEAMAALDGPAIETAQQGQEPGPTSSQAIER